MGDQKLDHLFLSTLSLDIEGYAYQFSTWSTIEEAFADFSKFWYTFTSFHQLNLTRPPSFVEPSLCRAVEAQHAEPTLAGEKQGITVH